MGLPLPQDNYEEDDEFEGGLNAPGSNNILPDLPPASDIILDPADYNPILPNPLLIPDLPFLSDLLNPPISPLVLDMDGDGIELVALSDSQAMFDLDNDNFAQHMGWVAADDALLAIDRNGNGRIDDINEVFGNGTVDGFTELAALDSNGDGTIDASDARFGDLRLWRDQNGNGRSEADELQGLADGGVRSIALNATASATTLAGHRISHTSSFTRTDGTTATIVDAWFENDRHISAYLPDDTFTLHADVAALPELRGYGVVADLSIAMTLDAGLRQRVTDLVREQRYTLDERLPNRRGGAWRRWFLTGPAPIQPTPVPAGRAWMRGIWWQWKRWQATDSIMKITIIYRSRPDRGGRVGGRISELH